MGRPPGLPEDLRAQAVARAPTCALSGRADKDRASGGPAPRWGAHRPSALQEMK